MDETKQYLSVQEIARVWKVSERSVRNYCSSGRVDGAFLAGKTWMIPDDAKKPVRLNAKKDGFCSLIDALRYEKSVRRMGGIYHKTQIEFAYNSNHIEGSRLTSDQTRYIFETNTIGLSDTAVNVDDIIETVNHFKCVDIVIDAAKRPLTEGFVKELHDVLKRGTRDSRKDWFAVGQYKRLPNEVGGLETTSPKDVPHMMKALLSQYDSIESKTFEDILSFHVEFERIHPFQDGNGRVGRLIMFKECLRYGIVPFIVEDSLKMFYYRGLNEWSRVREYLMDTCLTEQDRYRQWLEYFGIVV